MIQEDKLRFLVSITQAVSKISDLLSDKAVDKVSKTKIKHLMKQTRRKSSGLKDTLNKYRKT